MSAVSAWSDEATEQFLAVAADDLQWHIRSSGVVEGLAVEGIDRPTIVATVRVGRRTLALRGRGESLLEAYTELRRSTPEPLLEAAFREYVGRP